MRFERLKSPVGNTWFLHVWHIDGTTYVVGGIGSDGQVLRSDDDGDSWRVTEWKRTTGHGAWTNVMASDKQHGLRQIWGPTKDDVFVVGEYGTVLHSEDGGESFQRVKHPKCDCLFGCVGYRDKLFLSGDAGIRKKAGARWTLVDDSASKDLARLYVAGESLFCVGDKATVLRSDDGKSFRRMPFRMATDLYSFASVGGADRIIVGGTRGGLAASNDGGETWETTTTKDAVRWSGMVVIDAGTSGGRVNDGVRVLAFGERGLIVMTEDGGYSWSPVKTPVTTELWSGVVTKSGNLIVVGKDGTILRAPP